MISTRTISRQVFLFPVLSRIAALYIRFVWMTGHWVIQNLHIPSKLIEEGKPFVACFWHGRMLMIPKAWKFSPHISILISEHRDGILISRTLKHFRIGTISGSSSRGSISALVSMVRALKNGQYVGVTPDGPRGPRMKAAIGAIAAAKLSGAVIIPISYGATKYKTVSSWDRFLVPLPFSNGIIRIGNPIEVPSTAGNDEMETARQYLEMELTNLTESIDRDLRANNSEENFGMSSSKSQKK